MEGYAGQLLPASLHPLHAHSQQHPVHDARGVSRIFGVPYAIQSEFARGVWLFTIDLPAILTLVVRMFAS